MTIYYSWMLCVHCIEPHSDHADNKCLWQPTYYDEAQCIVCGLGNSKHFPQYAEMVGGRRYFLCLGCFHLRVKTTSTTESRVAFIREFLQTKKTSRDHRKRRI